MSAQNGEERRPVAWSSGAPDRLPEMLQEDERLRRAILAASRGAYVAVVQPRKHLADAARTFGYEARTLEGDAFETAFEWARENVEAEKRLRRELPRRRGG